MRVRVGLFCRKRVRVRVRVRLLLMSAGVGMIWGKFRKSDQILITTRAISLAANKKLGIPA